MGFFFAFHPPMNSPSSALSSLFKWVSLRALMVGATLSASGQITDGPCTRRTSVVLSEIHYHPANLPSSHGEFIELYNSSPISVDLSGWTLRGDADFDIPSGTRLEGGEFLIIAADPSPFLELGVSALGPWTGSLSNRAGTVRLRKASGGIVLETNYQDRGLWPITADGTGHSLILRHPSYGESRPEAWTSSSHPNGSPGAFDPSPDSPLDQLILSEIYSAPPPAELGFIELHNPASTPIDLSGCFITHDRDLPGFQVPSDIILAPGQYRAFNESILGFELDPSGGEIYLRAPDGLRVIKARAFGGQAIGQPWGGLSQWRELAQPTPNSPNASTIQNSIVINEIHYHPADGGTETEYLELFNSGPNTTDLSGWQFKEGINFTFPSGTLLNPASHLVIAKDRNALLARHPNLDPSQVLGDYGGVLSNAGERIELQDTNQRCIDTVSYRDGGRWPELADGGGRSLQLIDLRSDNALPSNWAAGDESGAAPAITIEHTGVLDFGHQGVPQATRAFIMLHGAGEALIDHIEVIVNGTNLIPNGTFDNDLNSWKPFGTHGLTFHENGAMHLVATDEGDLANLVDTTLSSPIPPGTTVTLRATCRWISGSPHLLLGLNGGFLEAPGTLPIPSALGTPGSPNSENRNTGPAITEVNHSPLLPQAGEPITIQARIADPDGIGPVRLRYRLDPSTSTSQITMTEIGDDFYTATIPAQSDGSMIAFHIIAVDNASSRTISRFPADAPSRECLVRVGSQDEAGDFSTMHLWTTNQTLNEWRDRERSSNLELDATFVSDGRAIYNVGTYYSGSQNGVTIYDSPIGNPTGYNIRLPKDEVFLNTQRLTIDRETTRDATRQRERLLFWFLEKLKLPNLHRRYVHFYFNGVERDRLIMEDVQRPNRDIIEQWFSDEGRLTKTNSWFEFDSDSNVDLASGSEKNLLSHKITTDGSVKIPPHRWTWTHGAGHDDGNDFSSIISLIDAAQSSPENLLENMRRKADLRQWMRTFAMNDLGAYWDTFGNPGSKNAYLFESLETRQWSIVTWDMDVGLGVFNDPFNAPLFATNIDPTVRRLYAEPNIVRDYWQALDESLETFFNATSGTEIHNILQETYDALRANDAPVTSPFAPSGPDGLSVDDWINQRRNFIQAELNNIQSSFSASAPLSSQTRFATLSGTTSLASTTLTANGITLNPDYTSATNWSAAFPLGLGENQILIESFDQDENPLGSELLNITYTGSENWANLSLNEWMASNSPSTGILDPADNQPDDWIELYNPSSTPVSLDGWYLSDDSTNPLKFPIPNGFTIPAGGHLLAWADDQSFQNNPSLRQELHLNFRLSASGESIILSAPDTTEIDRVDFGPQTSGLARLRSPDGSDSFTYTATPNPGSTNPTPPSPPLIAPPLLITRAQNTINFPTSAGTIYELEQSHDLQNWISTTSPVLSDGTPLSFPFSPDTVQRQFFRLIIHSL